MTHSVASGLWNIGSAPIGIQFLVMILVLLASVGLAGLIGWIWGTPIPQENSDEKQDTETENPDDTPVST